MTLSPPPIYATIPKSPPVTKITHKDLLEGDRVEVEFRGEVSGDRGLTISEKYIESIFLTKGRLFRLHDSGMVDSPYWEISREQVKPGDWILLKLEGVIEDGWLNVGMDPCLWLAFYPYSNITLLNRTQRPAPAYVQPEPEQVSFDELKAGERYEMVARFTVLEDADEDYRTIQFDGGKDNYLLDPEDLAHASIVRIASSLREGPAEIIATGVRVDVRAIDGDSAWVKDGVGNFRTLLTASLRNVSE